LNVLVSFPDESPWPGPDLTGADITQLCKQRKCQLILKLSDWIMPVIAAGSDRLNCPQAGTLSCLELEPIQDPEKKTGVEDLL